jgi:conjugative transfer signal peptidase TraF
MSRAPWVIVAGAAAAATILSLAVSMPTVLVWNASASAPRGLYQVAPARRLEVPDLVLVAPPERIAKFLDDGGYLPRGTPMLKRVAALPGQKVCRFRWAVTVDGVAFGDALRRDRMGRALPAWRGCRRVGAQQIFLMNFNVRDSLDGRYFGLMPRSAVVGRAIPLYTDEDRNGRFAWR